MQRITFGGTMITEPLVTLPVDSTTQAWLLSDTDAGFQELSFEQGTCLTTEMLTEILHEIRQTNLSGPVKLLVELGGLSDVCPSVANEISKAATTTRIALLGQTHVDRVLAGFLISDIIESSVIQYFTEPHEALHFLDPEGRLAD